jgi:DNA-binding NarL/FixJ family response regulator
LAELEMRLRRIGAEVLAARVFDDVAAPSRDRLPGGLTRRQSEVLSRLLDGKRVRSIAGELYVNPSTVRNHLAAIFRRFGVHTQAELLDLLRARAEAAHER